MTAAVYVCRKTCHSMVVIMTLASLLWVSVSSLLLHPHLPQRHVVFRVESLVRSSSPWSPNSNRCADRSIVVAASTKLGSDTDETSSTANIIETTNKRSFFILRHGQTDANAGGLIQGSADFSRLTDKGKEQAAVVAREAFIAPPRQDDNLDESEKQLSMTGTKIDAIYVSPLTRARETLSILRANANNNNLILPSSEMVLHNLREIDLYDWEGVDKQTLQKKHVSSYKAWKAGDPNNFIVFDSANEEEQPTEIRPLLKLWDRADKIWEEIHALQNKEQLTTTTSSSSSLLVCHGSLGQALLGSAMGWDATNFRKYEFPNCGLLEIEFPCSSMQQSDDTSIDSNDSNKRDSFGPASRWRWRWPSASDWNHKEQET